MQTFRKLPTQRPTRTAPATMTGSTPTLDLVEEDSRGHRDVEGLRAARERNGDALRGDGVELRPYAGAFVPDDHGDACRARLRVERARQRHAVRRRGPQRQAL